MVSDLDEFEQIINRSYQVTVDKYKFIYTDSGIKMLLELTKLISNS